jgi:Na+-translocating ferredoxin:NAD+ oxidoreductase RnfG subunit
MWQWEWPVVIGALAVTPSAFAVDYLTIEQVKKVIFPEAISFQEQTILLTNDQLVAIGKLAQTPARSSSWKIWLAKNNADKTIGFLVVDNVIGKFDLITFAVGIAIDGTVLGLEILSYRESHGGEVRLPFWRKQFVGKSSANPMRVGDDIRLISGATMSCNSVAEGVRRIAAVIAIASQKSS